MEAVGLAYVHLTLRRLHSQQLWVPLRILRLLGRGSASPTAPVGSRPTVGSDIYSYNREVT